MPNKKVTMPNNNCNNTQPPNPKPKSKKRSQYKKGRSSRSKAAPNVNNTGASRTKVTDQIISSGDSELVVKGEEYWFDVQNQTSADALRHQNSGIFWPGKSGLTRLDQYGAMFEQYRVEKCIVKYRTSSGTTSSGAILLGIDYEASDLPATLHALQVAQPLLRVPVWQSGELLPQLSKLNKAKWMFTAGGTVNNTPGYTAAFAAVASAPAVAAPTIASYGDVWCEYQVRFTGPTASNAGALSLAIVDRSAGGLTILPDNTQLTANQLCLGPAGAGLNYLEMGVPGRSYWPPSWYTLALTGAQPPIAPATVASFNETVSKVVDYLNGIPEIEGAELVPTVHQQLANIQFNVVGQRADYLNVVDLIEAPLLSLVGATLSRMASPAKY